ncbi:MAG: TonB-dependent receptor [Bacteroidetes bacterium]|nr:TonB-dependent receptor [Bacteroidota bacterium]
MIRHDHTFRYLATLFLALLVSFAGAQNLDRRISVSASNQPLGDVLKMITKKSGLNFSYSSQQIPVSKKVSIHSDNEPVRDILDKLLKPLNIQFVISEKQLILKPVDSGTPETPATPATSEKRKYTISGFVKDKASGEILIGANVYDKQSFLGTTTNAYGFFSLTLPEGTYDLAYSLVGYQPTSQSIDLHENRRVSFELGEAAFNMKEVEIVGSQDDEGVQKANPGELKFSNATLKQMPGFAGNIDVVKSLQSVPGINSFGDGSTFYYVRGGNSDQNLLLIDDAPIYNPSHLFGFFSALAPDAIKDVKAYKGDFPASYGGRLSSVIDVRSRDGNMKRLGFSGNLGPFTSDLTIEGPFKKEKSSFILSARRSNLNWLNFSSVQNRTFSIIFYDLNAKVNLRLNDNNRLFITAYNGDDDFRSLNGSSANGFGIEWKNSIGTLRWNHIFNSRLFSNTTAYYSKYDYFLYISRALNNYWTSAISNGSVKTDFTWYPNPKNTVKAGLEVSNHYSNPGNVHVSDASLTAFITDIPQYRSVEYSFYLSNEQLLTPKLSVRYGLRLTSWRDMGATTVYVFDGTHKVIDTVSVAANTIYQGFVNPEPRISMGYTFSENSSVRAGYCRTVQYLQMLSNSTSPFTSLEVWAPSGPTLKPQKADQYTLGYVRVFGKAHFNFSIETYYKKFYHQQEYKDHANTLYNPLIEGELRFGTAESYGVEVLLRKTEGKFTGWIGYSYSRAMRTIEDVNNGEPYPAFYDHPTTICFNLSYKSGRHWEYSANWIYLTGSAITTPVGFYSYNGYSVPIYGKKNNDRLPDYHRLDVAVTCWLNKPESKFKHSLVFSLYNAYGRNNPFSLNFNKVMDDQGKFYIPSDLDGNYEIVPTKLSVAGVIPSLNYTFRF